MFDLTWSEEKTKGEMWVTEGSELAGNHNRKSLGKTNVSLAPPHSPGAFP